MSYRTPGHKGSCLEKGREAGLGDLGRSRSLVLEVAAIDAPVITLEPQPMAGGRDIIHTRQFTHWLSSLVCYLLGGQHTLHFSIKPVIRISFHRVSSEWSSKALLNCQASEQPVVPVQPAISPQWFLHGVWQWQKSVRVDLPLQSASLIYIKIYAK